MSAIIAAAAATSAVSVLVQWAHFSAHQSIEPATQLAKACRKTVVFAVALKTGR